MLESLTVYAALGYVAIAFVSHLHYHWQNPQALELKRFDARLSIAEPAEAVDPLLTPMPELPETLDEMIEDLASLIAPAAIESTTPATDWNRVVPFRRPQPQIDWASKDSIALRKELTRRGLRWRNQHGDGKHLKKAEMLKLLAA